MASKVDICNRALIELGADTIIALTENTINARRCSGIYDEARQSVLRDHPWNCCTKQRTLAQLTDEPVFDWQYAYSLPSDCLRVLRVKDDAVYVIQGRKLYTDENSIAIEYIEDCDDPAQYDSMLRDALSSYIAWKLAYAITESTSKAQECYQIYLNNLSRARGVDAREGTVPLSRPSSWIRALRGGRSSFDSSNFTVPE